MLNNISYKRYLNKRFINSTVQDFYLENLYAGRKHFWSTTGRNGLRIFLKSLKLKKGDKIMVPAFAAHGIILPIRDLGLEIEFYKSNEDMSPNYRDIENKIRNKQVKVIFVIHYFGYPQRADSIFELARSLDVVSIEDCAQALFSSYENGSLIGTKGDVVLFSLTKFLPIPDGSLFVFNSKRLDGICENIIYQKSIVNYTAVFLARMQLFASTLIAHSRHRFLILIISILSKLITPLHYWLICIDKKPVSISNYSKELLGKLDVESIIAQRKSNARYLNIELSEYDLFKYRKFSENISLTGLPLILLNRKKAIDYLKNRNIKHLVYNKLWWFVPKVRKNEFQIEYNFLNNHLLLPLHENLEMKDLDRIIKSVKNILS